MYCTLKSSSILIKLGWSTGNDSGFQICSPGFDSWLQQLQDLRHFWIIFLLFKNSPNFGIFSMTPLLSGNYRKHRIFSDESRDTKEGLHIFFIAGMRWYVHKSGAWKSAFSLLKLGSLQMFTSHKWTFQGHFRAFLTFKEAVTFRGICICLKLFPKAQKSKNWKINGEPFQATVLIK